MSKKFFAALIVAVVAIFAGYNVYQAQSTVTLSDLALANEASDGYKYVVPGSDPSVKCVCSGEGSLTCC